MGALDEIDQPLYSTGVNRTGKPASGPDMMFQVIAAGHTLEARLEEVLEKVGLSLAWYGVLSHLADAKEPLALSALAARINCVRSNVTQLVDRLESEGLVRREDDPDDRRSIRAALTPLGRERQRSGEKQLEAVQAAFSGALSDTDRDALGRAVSALK